MEKKINQIYCCSCGTTLAETKGKIKTTSEYWVAFCKDCLGKKNALIERKIKEVNELTEKQKKNV